MKIKRSCFKLCLLVFACFGVQAQHKTDSLLLQYQTAEIEQKALLANEIAKNLMMSAPDSAEFFAGESLEMAIRAKNNALKAENLVILGKIKLMSDSLQKAEKLLTEAFSIDSAAGASPLSLEINLLLGYIYDTQAQYAKAHKVLLNGLRMAENNNDSVFLYSYYNNIGAHLYNMSDFNGSRKMYLNAAAVYKKLPPEKIRFTPASIYHNLSSIFIDLQQPDSALYYLNFAWNFPGSRNSPFGIFNMAANFAEIFLITENPDSALYYIEMSGAAIKAMESDFPGTTVPLLAKHFNQLGEVKMMQNDYAAAKLHLIKALDYATKANDLKEKSTALKHLANVVEKLGQPAETNMYLKQYAITRDSLNQQITADKLMNLKLSFDYEKELMDARRQIETAKHEKVKSRLVYLILFLVAMLLLLTITVFYLLQRQKNMHLKVEKELQLLEKEKAIAALEIRNREITAKTLHLTRKNEHIKSVSEKLNELIPKISTEANEKLKKIAAELNKSMESESALHEFEKRFNEVHHNFYQRLSAQFPELTAGDLRICAFLRLQMSNKEISSLTKQSADTLKTARYRLRKKLKLSRTQNLVNFLTSF